MTRKLGVTITDATDADYADLIANIRDSDRLEVQSISGRDLSELLLAPRPYSHKTWTARAESGLVAMFGYANYESQPGVGVPWMLATDLISQHEKDLLALSKPHIKLMEQLFDKLHNYVAADNDAAIRWLEWLGFKMDDPFLLPWSATPVIYFHKP